MFRFFKQNHNSFCLFLWLFFGIERLLSGNPDSTQLVGLSGWWLTAKQGDICHFWWMALEKEDYQKNYRKLVRLFINRRAPMRQYAKKYRERMLVKLSWKQDEEKRPEVLDADEIIAKYREEQENLKPQISRLKTSECPDSVCPKCFYMHGLSVHLKTSPGDDNFDRYRCPECKTIYEEPC